MPITARFAVREAALTVFTILIFTALHAALATDGVTATANADVLQTIERRIQLDVERPMNHWLITHDVLVFPAVVIYRAYYVVLLGVLLWTLLRHATVYCHVRRTIVAMAGIALLVFWALPMSPPRFALPGIVDVVGGGDIDDVETMANVFSAMPSLHVGWSALAAYCAWLVLRSSHARSSRHRRALLVWLFPMVMVVDVLATGNHYVLDVVGSAVLLLTSIALARVWGRIATSG